MIILASLATLRRPARGAVIAAALTSTALLIAACARGPAPGSAATTPPRGAPATKSADPSAAATAPAASPSVSPAGAGGPPACATSALRVSLGQGNGAAGSVYYPIIFANASGSSCSLYGFPGVSFVTSRRGSQVGAAALEDAAYPRRLVVLRPGASASALLRVTQAADYPPNRCDPVTARWLRVFPPNQYAPLYIRLSSQACARASVHTLFVRVVMAGPSPGQ
jgi:hypothetical protein